MGEREEDFGDSEDEVETGDEMEDEEIVDLDQYLEEEPQQDVF